MGSGGPRYGCGKREQKGWSWPCSEHEPTLLEFPRSPPTTKPFIPPAEPAEDPTQTPGAASRDQRSGPFKN